MTPLRRYTTVSIPASYGRLDDSPSPGTVAGIVLGSVAGFIFLLYLAYLGLGLNNKPPPDDVEVSTVSMSTTTESALGRRVRRARRGGEEESRRHPDDDHIVVEESMTSASRTDEGDVVEVLEEPSSVDGPVAPARSRSRRSRVSGSYRTVDPYEYGGESSYDGR
ncbi:uncharacterized protein P174DRAFT_460048 [Aspergillus novofumigatus IBT 16806]|uniref:Uncharacterized protein n=1 Tax=Aspergillus novofumigatus (strain IBT 16806) TaxID=1392255 RepID=A0A2I1C8K7_ASPN1|nr:uncharacterized protein P174DRAFT_460048 [Aspergillus novofumigatus IBT 16806]PKX93911.1 hypothetical protein P174DRAFT_460048 [Aspergillus novofumigatus IBT 16806]